MRRGYVIATGLALSLTLADGASAQQSAVRGSPAAGRDLAMHECDSCHIVAKNQDIRPLVGGYAPSFFDIANKPTTTGASLQAFISHPHGYSNMPYPDLAATDVDNVVAYILSLRGKP